MKTQNNNAVASWSTISSNLAANASFRKDMDELRSTKRFKVAVKQMVASMTIGERLGNYTMYLDVATELAVKQLAEIEDSLVGVNLDMVIKPVSLNKEEIEVLSDDEVAQRSDDWAIWSLVNKAELLKTRIDVLVSLTTGGKKTLSKILNAMVTVRARSLRSQVIVNAVVKSVSRLFVNDLDSAMVAIEIVAGAGFAKMHKAKTKDEKTEFVFEFKESFKELRSIYHMTSGRAARVVEPVDVTKSIVGKNKFAYEQPIEPMSDVINYLSQMPLSFKDGVGYDEVMSLIDLEVMNEDGVAIYDETWKRRIKENYLRSFDIVMEAGNVFYIPRATDGVARIYGVGEFGLHNSHHHHDLIEFADKEVINDDGRWALRQYFAEVEGYRPKGVKPTEEEAEDFWNSGSEEGYEISSKGQDILDMYYSSEPTGLGIEVDAQTQGPGIYGVLTGDEKLCFNTAIIGNTIRTDMYGLLASGMNSRLSVVAWTRGNCKSALMTKGYGAKYKTIMFGSGKDSAIDYDTGIYTCDAGSKKAVPLMDTANSVGITSSKPVWVAFKKTMEKIAPVMLETQAELSYIQEKLGDSILTWTMPDGVEATVATQKTVEIHIEWVDQYGSSHSMLHHVRVMDDDNSTALAPRFVQSVDAYFLRMIVRKMMALGINIQVNHDGFVVHPNHVKALMQAYREVLADVLDMDLMTDIVGQLLGAELSRSYRVGTVTREDILASKYAIWF